jgi:hypothetical protein
VGVIGVAAIVLVAVEVGSIISAGASLVGRSVAFGLRGVTGVGVSVLRSMPRRAVSVVGRGALLHAPRVMTDKPMNRVRKTFFMPAIIALLVKQGSQVIIDVYSANFALRM